MVDELLKEIQKCVRCGKCRALCPVFKATLKEPYVARGRLHIIEKYNLSPTRKYLEILSICLLCGACESTCSNKVHVVDIVQKARSLNKQSLLKRTLYRRILPNQKGVKNLAKAAGFFVTLFGKEIPSDSGLVFRQDFAAGLKNRKIRKIPKNNFLDKRASHEKESDIAIFTGCFTNYVQPEIGTSALSVLKSMNLTVDVPQEQACCGLMAFGAGDVKGAKASIAGFIDQFSKYEKILVLCGSCYYMLRKNLKTFSKMGEELSKRVFEISSFLFKKGFKGKTPLPTKYNPVVYHLPCHFRFSFTDKCQSRLLETLPGINLVDIGENCCGFGGSFTLSNPEISGKIGKVRADEIIDSGANCVTTSCSGCLMGLYSGFLEYNDSPKVVHPLVLLKKTL